MATDEEIQRLILEVEGRAEIERLKDALEEEEKWLRAAITATKGLTDAEIAADPHVRNFASNIVGLTDQIRSLEKATGNRSTAAGYAILEFSRGIEDLQYGIAGVLNNIPRFAQEVSKLAGISTGTAAAIAGGISLVAVGAYELYFHWDKLVKFFETETPRVVSRVDELKATIDELNKKKVKLDVDVERLEAAKRELKEIEEAIKRVEEARTHQTEFERASGRAIGQLVAEGPRAREAMEAVQRQFAERLVAESPVIRQIDERIQAAQQEVFRIREEAKRTGDAFGAEIRAEGLQREVGDLQAQRQQAVGAISGPRGSAAIEFGRLLGAAEKGTGEAQEQAQNRLVQAFERAGFGQMARKLEGIGPAILEGQKNLAEVDKRRQEFDKDQKQLMDKAARDDLERRRLDDKAERAHDRNLIEQELARIAEESGGEVPIGGGAERVGRMAPSGVGMQSVRRGIGGVGTPILMATPPEMMGGWAMPLAGLPEAGIEAVAGPNRRGARTVAGRVASARERRAAQRVAKAERRVRLRAEREARRRRIADAVAASRVSQFGRGAGLRLGEGAGMRLPVGVSGSREAIAAAQTALGAGAPIGPLLQEHGMANAKLLQAQVQSLQVTAALNTEMNQMKQVVSLLMRGFGELGASVRARSHTSLPRIPPN